MPNNPLSTILRHDHQPVILLVNNGGDAIERGYLVTPLIGDAEGRWLPSLPLSDPRQGARRPA
jgi:hypothetical protein